MTIINTVYQPHKVIQTNTREFALEDVSLNGEIPTSLGVDGDIQEVEFIGTIETPPAGTWATIGVIFGNATSNWTLSFEKSWGLCQNRGYYGEQHIGNAGRMNSTELFYQRTSSAVGTFNVDFKINKTGMYCTTGDGTISHTWTSGESSMVEAIFSSMRYIIRNGATSGNGPSWKNCSVKVTYLA